MNHQSWVPWVCYQAIAGFGEIRRAATRGKMLAALSRGGQLFFPESVWAKGSSNSGGLFYIFTFAHLHIYTHIIFTSSHLLSLSLPFSLSCPLSPSLSFFFFSFLRPPFRGNEVRSVRSSKTEVKLRFWSVRGNSFARNEVRMSKTEVKLRFGSVRGNLFARNEVRMSKTDLKIAIWKCRRQPFRTKWGSSVKNWCFFASLVGPVKGSARTSACV